MNIIEELENFKIRLINYICSKHKENHFIILNESVECLEYDDSGIFKLEYDEIYVYDRWEGVWTGHNMRFFKIDTLAEIYAKLENGQFKYRKK